MRAGLCVGACRRGGGFSLPRINRPALFASAAAGALLLAAQNPVRAQAVPPFTAPSPCAVSGVSPNKTVTCTGNISPGVVVANSGSFTGYTAVKIPSVTKSIAGSGSVISLTSPTSAYVLVNTGSYSVTSVGKAPAIKAAAGTGAAVVVSTSAGGIFAEGGGISAASKQSSVSVTSTGNITSSVSIAIDIDAKTAVMVNSAGALSGINGMTVNGDSIYIRSAGKITASASQGILATGQKGEVKVISDGDIKSVTHGLRLRSGSGDVIVETTGSIESQQSFGIFTYTATGDIGIKANAGSIKSYRAGIYANTSKAGAGNIVISGSVDILAQGKDVSQVRYAANGITAYTVDSANIMIDVTGNITSNHARGIYALSYYGAEISIKTGGKVSGAKQGIYAFSTHDAEINIDSSGGSITSLGDSAIYARNQGSSAVTVTGAANIYANSTVNSGAHGIHAVSPSGVVTVGVTGDVTSAGGRGIFAHVENFGAGDLTVTSGGKVTAKQEGIFAYAPASAVTVTLAAGSVTSSAATAVYAGNRGSGAVTVTGAAHVYATSATKAAAHGIDARSATGAVTVDISGNVTSVSGKGIVAQSGGSGGVEITSDGVVTAKSSGIEGSVTNGNLIIVNKGAVTSSAGAGIAASSSGLGLVEVTSSAAVTGGGNGISATAATANVTVKQMQGAVTATGGLAAVYAKSGGAGVVTVTVEQSVYSATAGIMAKSDAGSLVVALTGDIAGVPGVKANAGSGIDARSVSGPVSVTSNGNIGAYDNGISASSASGAVTVQSVGNVTSVSGKGIVAQSGSAGAVNVTSAGTVAASLEGIAALGGTGTVTVRVEGDVSSAKNSAIVVEGLGNLSVTAEGLTVGAAGYAGVEFGDAVNAGLGGVSNTLSITADGDVRNAGTLAELAIWGRTGSEAVLNSGAVTGSIDLGAGVNSFLNAEGGVFVTGNTLKLGAGNTLTNEGIMSVGGNDNIFTTTATGRVVQSSPGTLYVDFKPDINPAYRASDTIVLEGNATLRGTVVATQWAGTVVDAEQDFVILQTTGGVTADGLTLSIEPTPGYKASLVVVGQNLVLRFALERSTPPAEVDPDWAVAAAMSASGFSDTLIGCPRDSRAYAAIAGGQCLWMDSGGGYIDGDATNGNPAWNQTGWWIGGGGQFALAERFHLGLGVRYEDTSLDQGSDATTSGSLWNAGASLIYTSGPVLLAAAVSGGRGSLDVRREMEEAVASADHELDYAHGKLRAGYLFDYGGWYLKPLVDLDATWMSYGDFSEDGGAEAAAIRTEAEQKTLLSASPRVEIGGDVALENGVLLRPFLRVGATVFGDTGFDLGWRYVEEPADGPLYDARSELDPVMADVSAGLDVFGAYGLSARLYYDGSFGETIRSHAGGFTARMEF